MITTLVIGVTLAAAFTVKKGNHGKDGGNDGNTVTTQVNKARQSGFDNDLEQDATNLICTHPGEEYVGVVTNQILCLNEQS